MNDLANQCSQCRPILFGEINNGFKLKPQSNFELGSIS